MKNSFFKNDMKHEKLNLHMMMINKMMVKINV